MLWLPRSALLGEEKANACNETRVFISRSQLRCCGGTEVIPLWEATMGCPCSFSASYSSSASSTAACVWLIFWLR